MDFLCPRVEDIYSTLEQCTDYCLKSGPAYWSLGQVTSQQELDRRVALSAVQGSSETNRIKVNLEMCFEQYDRPSQFRREHPAIFAKNCNGIMAIYASRLREVSCEMPIIFWYFGPTRSGKTYQAIIDTGGKDNMDCYCTNGPVKWYSNYEGQSMILMNEFRHST